MWNTHGGNILGIYWVWWLLGTILLAWLFFANRKTLPDVGEKKDDPVDILNKRYAAGEITKEEYEKQKQELSAGK